MRRRLVVGAPPVEDSGAAVRAEPGPWAAGFVFAEPVAPAVETELPPAHDDEAAPSIWVNPLQAHDPVEALMALHSDLPLTPRTHALLRQAFSRLTQGSPP